MKRGHPPVRHMKQTGKYSAEWISAYYDDYAEREWTRFDGSVAGAVSLFIHTYYLKRFVPSGSRVLEIGAGPGRFTQALADLGCRVLVSDISQVQLDLHRKHSAEMGIESAVEDRRLLDICDLGSLKDDSFDAVLCYGGPLSYVFDKARVALGECARVCRKEGRVLASVMSLWGACHRFLPGVLAVPPADNRKITDSGDLTPENWPGVKHRCHMFRAKELRWLFGDCGLMVLAMSASHCISPCHDEGNEQLKSDPAKWHELLRMELEACCEEGCLDMGTHIIAVGQK